MYEANMKRENYLIGNLKRLLFLMRMKKDVVKLSNQDKYINKVWWEISWELVQFSRKKIGGKSLKLTLRLYSLMNSPGKVLRNILLPSKMPNRILPKSTNGEKTSPLKPVLLNSISTASRITISVIPPPKFMLLRNIYILSNKLLPSRRHRHLYWSEMSLWQCLI